MSNLKNKRTLWKRLAWEVSFWWDELTKKHEREAREWVVQKESTKQQQLLRLRQKLPSLLQEIVITPGLEGVLDYAIGSEGYQPYLMLRNYQRGEGIPEEILSDLDRLKLYVQILRPLKDKVFYLDRFGVTGFLESLGLSSDWHLFYNDRPDYGDRDGAALSDFWALHVPSGWKVVAKCQSHWYGRTFFKKASKSEERF